MKPRMRPLPSLEHHMHRMLRRRVLRHRKSHRAQVQPGKQRLTFAQRNRSKRKMQRIDQPSLQILAHSGNTSADLNVLVPRRSFRQPQRLCDSPAHKVERRSAFHCQRLTLVMRQNESRRMERRIWPPPSPPRLVLPRPTHRTEHIAPQNKSATIFHRPPRERIIHINRPAVPPVHHAECPRMEQPLENLRAALAQGIVQALLDPRAKSVQRNTKSRHANPRHGFPHTFEIHISIHPETATPRPSLTLLRLVPILLDAQHSFLEDSDAETTVAGRYPDRGLRQSLLRPRKFENSSTETHSAAKRHHAAANFSKSRRLPRRLGRRNGRYLRRDHRRWQPLEIRSSPRRRKRSIPRRPPKKKKKKQFY